MVRLGVQRYAHALRGVNQHVGNDTLVGGAAAGDFIRTAICGLHRLPADLKHNTPWLATVAELLESEGVGPRRSPGGVYLHTVAVGAADVHCTGQHVGKVGFGPWPVMHKVEAAGVV